MGLVNAVRDMRTIKRLLTQAEAEARNGGEETPGPEHLVLAATTLPDGTAGNALEHVGIDPQRLRTAIEEAHATALATVGIEVEYSPDRTTQLRGPATGAFRSTPQAQRVFQEAVALSKSTKPSRLKGAHVVAAICDLQHGTVPRALTALGVDRDRLREAARVEARTS
jgi:ATP-dependent Clp protease ATP-binding subunit ClpA